MTAELPSRILARAYALDAGSLDAQAQRLGATNWEELTRELDFGEHDSGGGCLMLQAALPQDHVMEITDGEAGLPQDDSKFYLSIVDAEGDELTTVFVGREPLGCEG